jgi:hypothetical protein
MIFMPLSYFAFSMFFGSFDTTPRRGRRSGYGDRRVNLSSGIGSVSYMGIVRKYKGIFTVSDSRTACDLP